MPLTTDESLATNLAPVTGATACKICGAAATLHGVVDFNKSCLSVEGLFFPLSGIPVWYHRCTECQFLFTEQFDRWTPEMFRRYVYNDAYALVDPEQDGTRAKRESKPLIAFACQVRATRLLDYGGGEGFLTRILNEYGFQAESWDPMRQDTPPPEAGAFDLVTAHEVLEHTPTPKQTCRDALSFLRPGGIFVFSTLTLDDLPAQSCDHWYIAPRNGHISIHTSKSLRLLFASLGWRVRPYGTGHHIAVSAETMRQTVIPGRDRMLDAIVNPVPRAK